MNVKIVQFRGVSQCSVSENGEFTKKQKAVRSMHLFQNNCSVDSGAVENQTKFQGGMNCLSR